MMLRELRKQKKLTQAECAKYLGVPLRTYQNYETDAAKRTSIKYLYMLEKLEQYGFVDEDHGILSIQKIKDVCTDVFADYDIEYCYLFGSYAKGKATETSDVDLLIGTSVSGIHFYGLVEAIREGLHKRVDILNREQLESNLELINEILKDGIKIYGYRRLTNIILIRLLQTSLLLEHIQRACQNRNWKRMRFLLILLCFG